MHAAVMEYVGRYRTQAAVSVVEIGSRDINGSVRPLFPAATWVGIDLLPGPRVDIVGDATQYRPDSQVDLVICCEVLEHAPNWRELIAAAAGWLKPSGRLIVTCAAHNRRPHSGIDGSRKLKDGEHYAGVSCMELAREMQASGLVITSMEHFQADTRGSGVKL